MDRLKEHIDGRGDIVILQNNLQEYTDAYGRGDMLWIVLKNT